MKIAVIGGTGLIGTKVVAGLAAQGHEAVPASPRLGINTITGEGLAAALDGASVIVDVSNFAQLRIRDCPRFLRHVDPAAAGRGGGDRRRPSRRAVGGRDEDVV
jgi:uncharacterized protein YbjT (DUF2867 family)